MVRAGAPEVGTPTAMAVSGARTERAVLPAALAPERVCEMLRAQETIVVDAEAPARARALLNRVADTVDPSARFQIDLVLTSLVSGRGLERGSGVDRDFCLEVSRAPGRVRVELVDDGQAEPAPSGELATPGHDLQLVAELADRWGMSLDGVTTVWFEFKLDTDG